MSAHDLKDVVVGDEVAVRRFSFVTKQTVTRTTAKQVVLDDGSRWTRRGYRVGAGGSHFLSAKPWDEAEHQERLASAARADLLRSVCRLNYHGMTSDQLRRIKAIAEEKTA